MFEGQDLLDLLRCDILKKGGAYSDCLVKASYEEVVPCLTLYPCYS